MLPALLDAFSDVLDGLRQPMLDRLERLELDRGPYLDGMLALRERREPILAGFREDLAGAWRAAAAGEAQPTQFGSERQGAHLDLVEEDELEVRLATERLAEVIGREWKAELLRLNGYLAWLDLGVRLDAGHGPYSPARIAMAVYQGLAQAALPGNVRALALQCCEREFVELIGPIYESVHARLVRELGPQDSGSPRRRRATSIPSAAQEEPPAEPDWLTRFFVSWDDGAAGAGQPKVENAAATLPPVLHQLLEESRQARARSLGQARPAEARTALSQRELVAALTLVQIAPPEVHAAILAAPKGLLIGFKEQIFAQAKQLGVAPEAVKLSEADENVVDLIGMLFEVVFKESHLAPVQARTLGRLIAPMTKVALQDRKLFLQATHPARRLLNVLVEACEGNRGETPEQRALLEKVEDTVQRLVADFDESQSVFRALRADFNGFYAQYRRDAEQAERALTQAQQAEEQAVQAVERARNDLAARLQGHTLPAPLRQALEADWPAHAVRMEAAGKPKAAPMMLDGLLQAAADAQAKGGAQGWQAAADWLQPMWMASGRGRADVAQRRQQLLDLLAAPAAVAPARIGAVERPAFAVQAAPRTREVLPGLLEEEELRDGLAHQDGVTADYFARLPVGSWLDFVDKDNRVQAGRLSWISPVSSRLMFVNRAGARICVASVQELVVMAQLGRVRAHRDEDAFYSAMQGVVDRLAPAAS